MSCLLKEQDVYNARVLEQIAQVFDFLARIGVQPSTLRSGGFRQRHSLYHCKYSIKVLSVLVTFPLCYNTVFLKSDVFVFAAQIMVTK